MILNGWKRDAERLVSRLPLQSLIARRAEHLLSDVSARGIEVDASIFGEKVNGSLPADAFLAVDRLDLTRSKTGLGRMALLLPDLAFVAHGEEVPSVLALPTYQPEEVLGNGSVFLYELEHITENEEGIAAASVGLRERRA